MTVEITSGGWEVAKGPDGHVVGRAQFTENYSRRQVLIRRWSHALMDAEGLMSLTWVMLNPSTAGAEYDDPTIRKCMGYAKRWGYGGIRVLNLFDLIATDPAGLREHPEPTSAANDEAWRTWLFPLTPGRPWGPIDLKPDVVVAWGDGGSLRNRDQWAAAQFVAAGIEPTCLGVTQGGQPLHPGRTSYNLERTPWKVL